MADTYMNDQNMFLDWNDEIENDGQEFVTSQGTCSGRSDNSQP